MKLKLTHISSLQLFQLMRFGVMVLIGVVFTKTQLSTESIGEYEQFIFLSTGISFFWLNGLIRGLLPISKEDGKAQLSPIFNAFLLISFFTILVILLLVVLGNQISGALLSKSHIPYLPLLLVYLFFSIPANLIEYYFLLKNQSREIVIYGIVSFSLMLLLVSLPVLLGFGILVALYGLLTVAILRYLYLLFLLVRGKETRFSPQFMKDHLTLASPLIVSALLSGSAQYVDGFIVTSRFDDATFAVFRFGARELPLVALMANAFSNAMLPEFGNPKTIDSVLNRVKNKSIRLANYLFPLSGLLLLLSHGLFPVLFNASFRDSATIFNIYLLLVTSRLIFPQTVLIGLKKTSLIATASFLELVVNVSLSLWFVTFWGIQGIAYATVIAFLFEKVFLLVMLRHSLNIPITKYQNIFRHLIYSLLLLAVFYLVEFVIY